MKPLLFEPTSSWILEKRGARNSVSANQPHAFLFETEIDRDGLLQPTATIFLTNKECPFRCLMCDLWKNTLVDRVEPGQITEQIDFAINRLAPPSPVTQFKLYNSGSFFDPGAIPEPEYQAISERCQGLHRVIVESHPAFIGFRTTDFKQCLPTTTLLQVAMGLETAHPEVLRSLNKKMTLNQFSRAASFLHGNKIELRVFVLLKPPFMEEGEALEWACKSINFAFEQGASVVSIIPTRLGNGAMNHLESVGEFTLPHLESLETALDYGINLQRGVALADLWDLEKFNRCDSCFSPRRKRLELMNQTQRLLSRIECNQCNRS